MWPASQPAKRPALLQALIYEPLRHLQRPLPLSPLFPAASTSSTRQVNNWSERGEKGSGGGRNFKECFFRSGGGGDDETDEKLRSRRPEAREEAVPIKKEGDPLAPQDKSESLKPHSGSHKDEIKSAEEERERGERGSSCSLKGVVARTVRGWEEVEFGK